MQMNRYNNIIQSMIRKLSRGYECYLAGIGEHESKNLWIVHYHFCNERLGIKNFGKDFNGEFLVSYDNSATFKVEELISAVEDSNPSFKFDGKDIASLLGKRIGLVLRGEEFVAEMQGELCLGVHIKVGQITTIDNVRSGNHPVFGIKPLL